ncbi:MAG: hypothetical protein ACYTEY_02590 [Planctomycetota bacterium]|jgi:hypothetical protein
MKRRILKFLALFVVGAAINVALTWGCSLLGRFDFPVTTDRGNAGDLSWHLEYGFSHVVSLFVVEWDVPWHLYADKELSQSVFPGWAGQFVAPPTPNISLQRTEGRYVIAYGWPLRCMSYEANTVTSGSAVSYTLQGGLEMSQPLGGLPVGGILPLRLILLGFVGNSLLYALLLLALLLIYCGARRAIRIRRRLCPICAYPFGKASVCTECGGRLPSAEVA